MPLLNKGKKKEAEAPAEEAVEGVTREEFDALQAQVTAVDEKIDTLIAEINASAEETPAEEAGEEAAEEAGEEATDETPTDDAPDADDSGEVQIPTVAEIKKADAAQLKEWRKTLFDEADAKRPLEEIRKELLEVAKSSEAGEAPADEAEAGEEEASAEETTDEEEKPPAKGKKGTNGNVYGLIQDAKTKLVAGVKMKPILQCTTDLDRVVRLANTYACFFDEKACKCKTGDKKAIAECWKEYLNDAETKKLIAKEKGAKAPVAPAKKPLLKKKK